MKNKILLAVVLTPFVLIGGCLALITFGPKSDDYSARAIQGCREAVRGQTGKADFSGEQAQEVSVVGESKTYRVRGKVDVSGGRLTYVCLVTATSDSSSGAVVEKLER